MQEQSLTTSRNIRNDERLPHRIARYQIDFSIYKLALWFDQGRVHARLFVQDEVSGVEEAVDPYVYTYGDEDAALIAAGKRIHDHVAADGRA